MNETDILHDGMFKRNTLYVSRNLPAMMFEEMKTFALSPQSVQLKFVPTDSRVICHLVFGDPEIVILDPSGSIHTYPSIQESVNSVLHV